MYFIFSWGPGDHIQGTVYARQKFYPWTIPQPTNVIQLFLCDEVLLGIAQLQL